MAKGATLSWDTHTHEHAKKKFLQQVSKIKALVHHLTFIQKNNKEGGGNTKTGVSHSWNSSARQKGGGRPVAKATTASGQPPPCEQPLFIFCHECCSPHPQLYTCSLACASHATSSRAAHICLKINFKKICDIYMTQQPSPPKKPKVAEPLRPKGREEMASSTCRSHYWREHEKPRKSKQLLFCTPSLSFQYDRSSFLLPLHVCVYDTVQCILLHTPSLITTPCRSTLSLSHLHFVPLKTTFSTFVS